MPSATNARTCPIGRLVNRNQFTLAILVVFSKAWRRSMSRRSKRTSRKSPRSRMGGLSEWGSVSA